MNRRGFLLGSIATPAIVQIDSLMKLKSFREQIEIFGLDHGFQDDTILLQWQLNNIGSIGYIVPGSYRVRTITIPYHIKKLDFSKSAIEFVNDQVAHIPRRA